MAQILFLVDFEEGHILATMSLSKTLAARGHSILYVGLPDAEDTVVSQGFLFHPIMRDVFPKGSRRTLQQPRASTQGLCFARCVSGELLDDLIRRVQAGCGRRTFILLSRSPGDSLPLWPSNGILHNPDKSPRWCYEKYLTQVGDRHYVLEGTTLDRRGKPRTIRLVNAKDVPIKRHVKIKAAANPYDPNWESYFEERHGLQMRENFRGYEKLLKLWFNQNGRCPHCGQKITPETGWHLHHRVWVVNGGDDSMANLVVMHPICHMQLHGGTVVANSFGCCTASSEEGV